MIEWIARSLSIDLGIKGEVGVFWLVLGGALVLFLLYAVVRLFVGSAA